MDKKSDNRITRRSLYGLMAVLCCVIYSCAKMGQPDGGWYDETPPRVIKAIPEDKGTNVNEKRISIFFDEFIKLDNPSEKVVISPPQLEAPDIKGVGKRIDIKLRDSLKQNTTYTIDFSDAISDNTEGNPLGNYTYSFSTGDKIDTLEVSGCVLDAENLEPIKGILVGLYSDTTNVAFTKKAMLRVSRTDSRGRFVIKGVASGTYRIYALQDADANYFFNQKSERIAFTSELITPSFQGDIRQDTIWADSLRIKNIIQKPYTRFLPDNIVLKAFTEQNTDRYFLKSERKEPEAFSLYFSSGSKDLPQVRGLNFNSKDAFLIETSAKRDSLTYWIKDTALVNNDSLEVEIKFLATDSTGALKEKLDTLPLVPRLSYAKRLKLQEQAHETWKKKQEKLKKKGEPFDSIMPKEKLRIEINPSGQMAPDRNILLSFKNPIVKLDTSKVHLFVKHDSLWYQARYKLSPQVITPPDSTYTAIAAPANRFYELKAEWKPGAEYSLELDSMAFVDLYGSVSGKEKQGFRIKALDEYSTILFTLSGVDNENVVLQLLNNSDKVVKQIETSKSTAEMFYVEPSTYYVRAFIDRNKNGLWDTGDYARNEQPEEVYYYPEKVECKAKWDVTVSWNLKGKPLNAQKPGEITKQKADNKKTIRHRNQERAREKGLEYLPNSL